MFGRCSEMNAMAQSNLTRNKLANASKDLIIEPNSQVNEIQEITHTII